jgi:hypothetical protein
MNQTTLKQNGLIRIWVVSLNIQVFGDTTPDQLVNIYQWVGGRVAFPSESQEVNKVLHSIKIRTVLEVLH